MKPALLVILVVGCFGCGSTAASSSDARDAGMEAPPADDGVGPDPMEAGDTPRDRTDGGPQSCISMHIDCFGGFRGCDPQTGVASEQIRAPINCPWNQSLGRCSCDGLTCAIAQYRCADGCRTDPGASTDDGGSRPDPDGAVTTSGPEVGFIPGPHARPWLACREYAPPVTDAAAPGQ